MAKKLKIEERDISALIPYENNPRKNDEAVDAVAASIREFGYLVPIVVDKDGVIVAGHTRLKALKQLGHKTAPVVVADDLTPEQIKAFRMADNKTAELAGWDFAELEKELAEISDIDMTDFGFPKEGGEWFENRKRFDNENDKNESDEYQEFVNKFKQPKTIDDCFTPDVIYDAVAGYVSKRYGISRDKFIRPFYPGGDYENAKYPAGTAVVDNPPFSILAKIVDFYQEHGVKFFLFAPSMTILNYATRRGVQVVVVDGTVTYENKANVNTSFLTNMEGNDIVARSDPELYKILDDANQITLEKLRNSVRKLEYPVEVVTSAKLAYLSKYGQTLGIRRDESVRVTKLDAMEDGDSIYGGGLLIAEKAAAEKAAAHRFPLSDREKQIVAELGKEKE